MGSANKVPFCFAGYDASDIRQVVPVSGLTGFAIISLCSYNLMEPIGRLELDFASRSHFCRNCRTLQGSGHGELDTSPRGP